MKFEHIIVVTSIVMVLASTSATAKTGVTVKWPKSVGETIKLMSVNVEPSVTGNIRMATFTYEALKSCRNLNVFGHAYTKDDIQEGVFQLGAKMDVKAGQKFKDQTVLTLDPGGYIIVDKAYCS